MTHPLSSDEQDFPTAEGFLLTPEFLEQRAVIDDHEYHRHANGGGWVANSAIVSEEHRVLPSKRIGPYTELIDDKNLAGLLVIQGDMSLDEAGLTPISRDISRPDVDIPLRLL